MKMTKWIGLGLLAACVACGTPTNENNSDNNANNANNGKNDTPDGDAAELCPKRLDDVLKTGKPRFLNDFIRWPISDVEGVTADEFSDDRGQEYGEYFAVLQGITEDGSDFTGEPVVLGHKTTQLPWDLNEDQQFFLEDQEDAVIGSCVFTSWHADIPGPLPCETAENCPNIYGVELGETLFRMRNGVNSNRAASDLVQKCIGKTAAEDYQTGDPDDSEDLLNDDFIRGCFLVADLFGTHFRSSDPQICAASMRLAECGCTVGGDASVDVGFALVPPYSCPREFETADGCSIDTQIDVHGGVSFRGFPLGTWDDPQGLPTGCRYVEIGDEILGDPSRTIVECDLRANAVKDFLEDPKEVCRRTYGEDVVVHVPVPAPALECAPADRSHANTCSDSPWVVSVNETFAASE